MKTKTKIIIAAIILSSIIFKTSNYINPVTVIDYKDGRVYVEDEIGNVWSYYGDKELIGTKHIYVMSTHFTKTKTDDTIIKEKYCLSSRFESEAKTISVYVAETH